jgi:glycosyltransferase involved in cell wall biosynthesis
VSTPIRICLITSKHTIRDSRVFGCFFRGIEQAGGQVTVIGPSADEAGECDDLRSIRLPVPASANEDTLRSLRLSCQRIKALAYLFVWCLRLRPDVIQACDPDSWVIAWLAARLLRSRAVFDVHEMFPAYLAGHLPARWQRTGEVALLHGFRWLLRGGDAVFHVSEARREYYGVAGDRHFAVPSYPPLAIADFARPTGERTLDVVHLGKVVEPTSREALVEALRYCRNAGRRLSTLIIGQTRGDFVRGLGGDAAAMLTDLLQFVDPLPHHRALELAATARIGLALYDSETASRNIVASRKLFEYMALGLAVVGSRVRGISDLVERHDIGTVVPLDSQALGSALLSLSQDANRLQHCEAVGRAAFRRDYNWDVQSGRVMSIYTSLIRPGGNR